LHRFGRRSTPGSRLTSLSGKHCRRGRAPRGVSAWTRATPFRSRTFRVSKLTTPHSTLHAVKHFPRMTQFPAAPTATKLGDRPTVRPR
jgi:hypothetical protein